MARRRSAVAVSTTERDGAIAAAVERWFRGNARELPWRPKGPSRDPYHALVSEAMLQQTQVSRVVERFGAFIERFPTVHALAAAEEGEVLGLWSGLGYYRRARSLHAAAKAVVAEWGGRIPEDVEDLRRLPGVGRYTAGAISSIAFGRAAPIVDGNVMRVLMRVENRSRRGADPASPAAQRWAWERAGALVAAAGKPGVFNEGLMELGATVCTPRSPRCEACPLRDLCLARGAGTQEQVPLPKRAAARREIYFACVVAADGPRGKVLVEQRPARSAGEEVERGASGSMWAGLWQAPTLERADRPPTAAEVAAFAGVAESAVAPAGAFVHTTSHRLVHFRVWSVRFGRRRPARGEWMDAAAVAELGLSNPQRRILLGTGGGDRQPSSQSRGSRSRSPALSK